LAPVPFSPTNLRLNERTGKREKKRRGGLNVFDTLIILRKNNRQGGRRGKKKEREGNTVVPGDRVCFPAWDTAKRKEGKKQPGGRPDRLLWDG